LHGFGTREVYEAEDGAAGLEAFTHYMPEIVLTDWFMPIFDGLELAQMIRQPGANANPTCRSSCPPAIPRRSAC
jgi:two-component system, chemotaxis family, chemotaxis protein CheY